MRQGWGIWHCEYDVQGNRRLYPVAIIVVFVCVVLHALRVNTNKRAFNSCVVFDPTGLRGHSFILHTLVNLGVLAAATQNRGWKPTHDTDLLKVRVDSGDDLRHLSDGCWTGLTLARRTIVSLRLSLPANCTTRDYHLTIITTLDYSTVTQAYASTLSELLCATHEGVIVHKFLKQGLAGSEGRVPLF